MAGDWETVRVKDIAKRTATGPFGSAISSKHFVDSGVPVIRGSNLSQVVSTRLDDSGLVFVSEEKAAEFRRSEVHLGDLVFTCWGTIDQVGLIDSRAKYDRYIVSNKQMLLTPDESKVDSLYLYYYFASPETRAQIINEGIGSSVPGFNLGQLRSFEIPLPPLAEQKAIAAVLGALDDKIELNRRMNATLEAMARALFQSWFVDFDPVRAKLDGRPPAALDPATAALFPDSFQDSPLGHIPKGWEIRPLAEAFDIKDGATFKKEDRLESGSIIAFGANGPVGFSTRANVTEPCIALGKIGSCGSLHRSWNPCWITNNAFVVKPHRGGSLEFMWRTLCTIDFTQFIGGSANPYMPLKNFGHTPVVMPPAPLLTAFQERAGSLAAKIVANDEQSRTLATLRDTLLPKLLSGELSVDKLGN